MAYVQVDESTLRKYFARTDALEREVAAMRPMAEEYQASLAQRAEYEKRRKRLETELAHCDDAPAKVGDTYVVDNVGDPMHLEPTPTTVKPPAIVGVSADLPVAPEPETKG